MQVGAVAVVCALLERRADYERLNLDLASPKAVEKSRYGPHCCPGILDLGAKARFL
jgi:hypothetical protein